MNATSRLLLQGATTRAAGRLALISRESARLVTRGPTAAFDEAFITSDVRACTAAQGESVGAQGAACPSGPPGRPPGLTA